jgi:hypothetical protein
MTHLFRHSDWYFAHYSWLSRLVIVENWQNILFASLFVYFWLVQSKFSSELRYFVLCVNSFVNHYVVISINFLIRAALGTCTAGNVQPPIAILAKFAATRFRSVWTEPKAFSEHCRLNLVRDRFRRLIPIICILATLKLQLSDVRQSQSSFWTPQQ